MNGEQADEIIENLDLMVPPEPFAWLEPVSLAVVALSALLLLLWYLRRRSRLVSAATIPVRHAAVALESLRQARLLIREGNGKHFVMEVSKILRVYLEGRFGLSAPNLSTEEFLYVSRENEELRPGIRKEIARFLADCDRVKFALAGLQKGAMVELLESAIAIVERTQEPSGTTASARPAPPAKVEA